MRTFSRAVCALLFGALSAAIWPAAAQEGGAQEKIAALKQSLAQNQSALRQYSWTETTEISLKGEVKKRLQKACSYDANGKVQKTPIDGDQPQQEKQPSGRRGGKLKEKIVEKKVDEMQDYMERASALIQSYIPPDGDKLAAAAKSGNASLQKDPSGAALLVFKDYLKPNDQLSIGVDAASAAMKSLGVSSYLDQDSDKVTLNVNFAMLPGGPNYPAETVLDAKAKNITVKITNSVYRKTGQ
jgi:hypothetical protein